MANISDLIEQFIKEMLEEDEGYTEIKRNELASKFNCVPSQINYVITTRFSGDRGYYVESKRGGGGSIKIRKLNTDDKGNYLMHIILSMGDYISQQSAFIFINNFYDYDIIDEREARLMKGAVSDKALGDIEPVARDYVRAKILKNMLMSINI